jgi:hypothetical protein
VAILIIAFDRTRWSKASTKTATPCTLLCSPESRADATHSHAADCALVPMVGRLLYVGLERPGAVGARRPIVSEQSSKMRTVTSSQSPTDAMKHARPQLRTRGGHRLCRR